MTFEQYVPPELALDFGTITELPQRDPHGPRWPRVEFHAPFTNRVLLSWHYYQKQDVDALFDDMGGEVAVFVDCGAFSASTQGVEIDLDEYAAWCVEHQDRMFVVSNLDAIGDPVTTLRNQRRMEDHGVDALPVFHVGEDHRYLEAYCEQYAYVALGGMVGYGGNINNWLAKCFLIGEKYDTRFHGFGQTRDEQLRVFPFFSVDSSSWGVGHRYAILEMWDPDAETIVSVPTRELTDHHRDLIRASGVDPAVFVPTDGEREKGWHHEFTRVNSVGWVQYAEHLRKVHGPVELRDDSRPPGLHMFLVAAARPNLISATQHCAAFFS